jgi:hypothetical protein
VGERNRFLLHPDVICEILNIEAPNVRSVDHPRSAGTWCRVDPDTMWALGASADSSDHGRDEFLVLCGAVFVLASMLNGEVVRWQRIGDKSRG